MLVEAASYDTDKKAETVDMYYTQSDIAVGSFSSMLSSVSSSSLEEEKALIAFDLGAGDGRLGVLVHESSDVKVSHVYLVENDERRREELELFSTRKNISVLYESYLSVDFYTTYYETASLVVCNPDFNIVMQTMCIAAMLLKLSGFLLILSPVNILARKNVKRWSFIERLGFQHVKTDVLGYVPFTNQGTGKSIKSSVAWFLFTKTVDGAPRISLKTLTDDATLFQEKAINLWTTALKHARSKVYIEFLFLDVYDMFKTYLDMKLVTGLDFMHLSMQFVYPDLLILDHNSRERMLWEKHLCKILPFLTAIDFNKLQMIDLKRLKSLELQYMNLCKIFIRIPKDIWGKFRDTFDVSTTKSLFEFGEVLLELAGNSPMLKNPYRAPRSSMKREREIEPIFESEQVHLIELIRQESYEELMKFMKKKGYK